MRLTLLTASGLVKMRNFEVNKSDDPNVDALNIVVVDGAAVFLKMLLKRF